MGEYSLLLSVTVIVVLEVAVLSKMAMAAESTKRVAICRIFIGDYCVY